MRIMFLTDNKGVTNMRDFMIPGISAVSMDKKIQMALDLEKLAMKRQQHYQKLRSRIWRRLNQKCL